MSHDKGRGNTHGKSRAHRRTPPATRPYDAAEFLRSDEGCALYLQAVMDEEGVTEQNIAAALGDIARARGMTQLTREECLHYFTACLANNQTRPG